MKFPRIYTLKEIASIIEAKYVGEDSFEISGTNEIHRVQAGEIVFVDHPKYYDKALESNATVILINKEVESPAGKALIISEDPFKDFNTINEYFRRFEAHQEMISKEAVVGEGTILEPNVFIGRNVEIGKNCIIYPNVVIHDFTKIGDNVIIQAGTIIGGDAFYYKNRGFYDRLKSVGDVVIKDNVEIGSNCAIDRGVTSSTIIEYGTKIDNLVQIGHDTEIGKKCLIASQVGIAGCCNIEDNVTIWGQVGMASSITIGEGAIILAQSGVSKSLDAGKTYFGYPAEESREALKKMAKIASLIKK